jgi:hypothetical protein
MTADFAWREVAWWRFALGCFAARAAWESGGRAAALQKFSADRHSPDVLASGWARILARGMLSTISFLGACHENFKLDYAI